MATQHEKPARVKRTSSRRGDRPASARAAAVTASARRMVPALGRRRIKKDAGTTIAATATTDARVGRPPADQRHGDVDHERPDDARDIIAGRDDHHGQTAPAHEPVRNVGHQRPEADAAAEADQHMRRREEGKVGAAPAATKPAPRTPPAIAAGVAKPMRSDMRPQRIVPAASASIITV